MKFKFPYDKLLEYHQQQEEIAQRDLAESMVRYDAEKLIYENQVAELEAAKDISFQIKSGQIPVSMAKLVEIDGYIVGQEVRIRAQAEILNNHAQIIERKREILLAAIKEVRMYSKLKEKRFKEFKERLKRKEAKLVDELVVTRFKVQGEEL